MQVRLVKELDYTPCGHETISVLDSAPSLLTLPASEPIATDVVYAVISVSDADIRYWEDGGVPTSTDGLLVTAPGIFDVKAWNSLSQLQMICVSGTANVNVQYYKQTQPTIMNP